MEPNFITGNKIIHKFPQKSNDEFWDISTREGEPESLAHGPRHPGVFGGARGTHFEPGNPVIYCPGRAFPEIKSGRGRTTPYEVPAQSLRDFAGCENHAQKPGVTKSDSGFRKNSL